MKTRVVILLGTLHLISFHTGVCVAGEAYHLVKEIPIREESKCGCLSIDSAANRLYLSGENKMMIVGLDSEAVVGEITNTPLVNDFALCPRYRTGFFRDEQSYLNNTRVDIQRIVGRVETSQGPGAVFFEPSHDLIYVFSQPDQSVKFYEADDVDFVTTLQLPGTPASAAADPKMKRVYCNIEDKDEVAVFNAKTLKIINDWPTAPGESPAGIALDPVNHRLFIGCANKLVEMMDSTNGQVLTRVPVSEAVTQITYDSQTQLAFIFSKDGAIAIVHEDTPNTLSEPQALTSSQPVEAMALDPKTHKIYLAVAQNELSGQSSGSLPAGLKILVYEKDPSSQIP